MVRILLITLDKCFVLIYRLLCWPVSQSVYATITRGLAYDTQAGVKHATFNKFH